MWGPTKGKVELIQVESINHGCGRVNIVEKILQEVDSKETVGQDKYWSEDIWLLKTKPGHTLHHLNKCTITTYSEEMIKQNKHWSVDIWLLKTDLGHTFNPLDQVQTAEQN